MTTTAEAWFESHGAPEFRRMFSDAIRYFSVAADRQVDLQGIVTPAKSRVETRDGIDTAVWVRTLSIRRDPSATIDGQLVGGIAHPTIGDRVWLDGLNEAGEAWRMSEVLSFDRHEWVLQLERRQVLRMGGGGRP